MKQKKSLACEKFVDFSDFVRNHFSLVQSLSLLYVQLKAFLMVHEFLDRFDIFGQKTFLVLLVRGIVINRAKIEKQ